MTQSRSSALLHARLLSRSKYNQWLKTIVACEFISCDAQQFYLGPCTLRTLDHAFSDNYSILWKLDRFQKLKQFVVGIRQDDKLQIWHRKALLVDYAKHWILGSDHHFRLSKENKKTKEIHICQGKETLVKLWNWISVHTSLLIVEVSNKLFKIRKTGIVFINTAWNMQDRTGVRIIILYIPY